MAKLHIRTKVKRILERIKDLEDAHLELQHQCTHPNVAKVYKGDSGNYDSSNDYYWIEFTCPDCKKFWTEDQ